MKTLLWAGTALILAMGLAACDSSQEAETAGVSADEPQVPVVPLALADASSDPFPGKPAYLMPASAPQDEPLCGDFEDGANWPARGVFLAAPRGYPDETYGAQENVPGALFAGIHQWGGQRCGGWCEVQDDGVAMCKLRNLPSANG